MNPRIPVLEPARTVSASAGSVHPSHLEAGMKQAFMKYVLNTEYENTGLPQLTKSRKAGTLTMLSETRVLDDT